MRDVASIRLRGATLLAAVLGLACSDPILPDVTGARLEVVAEGLDQPLFLTSAPGDDSRLFVVEKPGRIRVVRDGVLLAQPFLDIASATSSNNERGLLGLAFHPEYPTNGYVYLNHTDLGGDTRILRFTAASADAVDSGSQQLVLEVDQPYANHNGGMIAFGPDGMLYVGMGDGGSGGDPDGHGQNRATLLGSLLRLDVSSLPYAIPPDNPFVGQAGVAPETFAWGLRNPWRFSFDRTSGDLWVGDVGQNVLEEISWASPSSARGGNFGWAIAEGSRCYPNDPCDMTGLIGPLHEYDHDDGCSVTGGYVYRGQASPALQGRYFYGDFCAGWVRSFRREGTSAVDHADHTDAFGAIASLASFGEDGAGELYVMSLNGTVWRIVGPD